ncbi:SIR2 family protein [Lactobacillus delbrueckii subsp. bulgaricus]|uniref:SIR2 family protein n=1 Tax=Lactobacillus delbrueckii TaxID=1584 RepID=UPI001E3DDA84|nr:SIR2 family protein [Lactobacillus delbrueckii]MCD5461900.1 SIR2 family protein [Lactobacillus delbrueckii subsp. bulgaricus]MCD5477299.1 SIR2 family protein [Lactobacillus delbrueckii subsp. bulgaricus]MCD5481050.1 SIR2 family protein [Lactobacillus delbrueckii subsp. bulgaricus]UUY35566.1 SIR2 family protein [Lactobacillus delbrueckii subsp. bulgaricus]
MSKRKWKPDKQLKASYEEAKKIIKDAMLNKNLVLFVGAGVSKNSGMPLWSEAVDQIAKAVGVDPKKFDNLKIPQFYYNDRGKKEYTQFMKQIFRYGDVLKPCEIHNQIVDFDLDTIITTNYDNLIEQAFQNRNQVIQPICQDSDLSYAQPGKELIKMHGDFEHDNFVLKEDDYLNYSENFKLIENYVKSLVGSKVILFIGYSFSDPDTKQIFTWVKNTLKDDAQRAYMLEVGQNFDRNVEQYYRNLGVNVIFTKSWFRDLHSPSNNLENALDLILRDTEDPIESIYDDFKPFANFKYVYTKYVAQVLREHNISVESGQIYVENYLDKSQKEAAQRLVKRIFSNKSNSTKVSFIQSIIKKSGIDYYQKDNQVQEIDKPSDEENWVRAVLDFDFMKLTDLRNTYEIKINSDDPEQSMKLAAIDYYLEDYVGSYNYLQRASWQYYRQKKLPQYFISQVNLKYDLQLAKINSNEKLCKELDKRNEVNLDQTFESLPLVERNRMKFLRELSSFSISYSLFERIYVRGEKTLDEANSLFWATTGQPAYKVLRSDIKDFFYYEFYNNILLDHYKENTAIFHMYMRTILSAVATPTRASNIHGISSYNITPESLEWFDIFIMLRFTSDPQELRKILDQYDLASIKIDEEARKYLYNIIPNLVTDNKQGNRIYSKNLFWQLICLCGYIKIDQEVFESLLVGIDKLTDFKVFDRHWREIDCLLIAANQESLLSKKTKEIIKNILKKDLEQIAKENDPSSHEKLTQQLLECSDKVDISFTSEIKALIDNKKINIVVDVYQFCSKKIQKIIREAPEISDLVPTPTEYAMYLKMVQNNIIKMKKADNDKIISWLNKQQEDKKYVNDEEENVTLAYCNLILINPQAVKDKEKIVEVIKKSSSEISKWVIDVDGFDYSSFNLNWLLGCSGGLLKVLARKPIVRKNVAQEVKKQFLNRTLDEPILKIYMKYFV